MTSVSEDEMTTATDWPFDADQNDPLAKLRIPVVSNPYPEWGYEVALVIGDDDLRPTDAEVKQILAYLEFRMAYYNAGWRAKMRKRPLDVDSTTNTTVLQKRGEGDWCYRRAMWRYGPAMVPARSDGEEPSSLPALLDRVNGYLTEDTRELVVNSSWQEWKAAHRDAFPDAPAR